MKITVDKQLKTPLYWQISNQIRDMIITGQLPHGAILPSERSLAKILDVHRNTVVKAYADLKDKELIAASQGIGHTVEFLGEGKSKDTASRSNNQKLRPVNWDHAIKDQYLDMEKTFDDIFSRFDDDYLISFAGGMAAPIYDKGRLAIDMAEILNEEGKVPMFFSPYQGDTELRQRILAYLRTKGIKAGLSEVQIMSETNQALDFIATALLSEGDTVITEEPMSPDVYRVVELAGCKVIPIPLDENGMQCDNIEPIIERYHPKFIYVNSSYHDPTSVILSLERRKKLMEISNKYRLPIIEEDAASELSYDNASLPTLKSMDTTGNVIYIYSFSLTFVPGLTMAFIVGSAKLIKSISYLVSIRLTSLDLITQKLLAKYLANGTYYRKLDELLHLYREKRDLMCAYLDDARNLGISYTKPCGGVYVWCKLPPGLDSKTLVNIAFKEGISLIPGDVFYPLKNGGKDYIRLNYSYESKDRIKEGMAKLIEIIKKSLAH